MKIVYDENQEKYGEKNVINALSKFTLKIDSEKYYYIFIQCTCSQV